MKNYYEILGVEEEASGEEIRAHWIELTKRYHPDLGRTEEGDEKIREINEAYEILKDDLTRFHYDFERDLKRSFVKKAHRRQLRRMNIRRVIIPSGILVLFLVVGFILFRSGSVATPPGKGAKTAALDTIDKVSEKKTASQTPPVRTDSKAQDESRAPMEIKKEVKPLESKEVVSLPPPRPPSSAEREKEPSQKILPESKVLARLEKEVPKPKRKEIPQEKTRVISAPLPPPAKKESKSKEKPAPQVVVKSIGPETKEASKEIPKEAPRGVAKEIPKEVSRETSKQVAKEVPREIAKEIPKEILKEPPKEVPKEVARVNSKEAPKEIPEEAPKEVVKEVPKDIPREVAKEVPKEVAKETPKEVPKESPEKLPKEVAKVVPKESPKEVSSVTLHPGKNLTLWTKGETMISSRPSLLAKEEEVKEFFSNYIDRYNHKDIRGFLSFFSARAIQNQTDGFGAISNFYAKFINQSQELRYQLEEMKIEISQSRVDVGARFRIDQKLKSDGEEKVWKGNIRWVLVKEDGRLKIRSLDYQNEKSP